jgi:hypothetical protein
MHFTNFIYVVTHHKYLINCYGENMIHELRWNYMGGELLENGLTKQLSNFVNALIAISPSRNYVTQFLYIIKINDGIDYKIIEETYPEIVKDEYVRESFAKAFGVSFKDKVTLEPRKYGEFFVNFLDSVLQIFEDAEFRSKVGFFLKNEYPQGIPNLAQEWLEVRLKGLSSEPTYGMLALKVLKEIVRVGRATIEELEKSLSMGRGDVIETTKLLKLYGLIKEDLYGFTVSESLKKYQHLLEGV